MQTCRPCIGSRQSCILCTSGQIQECESCNAGGGTIIGRPLLKWRPVRWSCNKISDRKEIEVELREEIMPKRALESAERQQNRHNDYVERQVRAKYPNARPKFSQHVARNFVARPSYRPPFQKRPAFHNQYQRPAYPPRAHAPRPQSVARPYVPFHALKWRPVRWSCNKMSCYVLTELGSCIGVLCPDLPFWIVIVSVLLSFSGFHSPLGHDLLPELYLYFLPELIL